MAPKCAALAAGSAAVVLLGAPAFTASPGVALRIALKLATPRVFGVLGFRVLGFRVLGF